MARTERNQDVMLAVLNEIRQDVSKISQHVHMDTPPVNNFFPIISNEAMFKFLDNSDGKLDQRKRELDYYLDTTISRKSTRRTFMDAFLNAVFSRDYIKNVKWPVCQ